MGIHARPAGDLVKFAKEFESEITVTNQRNGKSGSAKKLFSILSAVVKCQDTVTVTIEGPDEEKALREIREHFAQNL